MPSGVGTMIDRAASLQPARAPKQQIPLAPCKGRGRFPAHEEERLCLPTGSVGSILGKATSTTDFWNTVKQTNKQTNKALQNRRYLGQRRNRNAAQEADLMPQPFSSASLGIRLELIFGGPNRNTYDYRKTGGLFRFHTRNNTLGRVWLV